MPVNNMKLQDAATDLRNANARFYQELMEKVHSQAVNLINNTFVDANVPSCFELEESAPDHFGELIEHYTEGIIYYAAAIQMEDDEVYEVYDRMDADEDHHASEAFTQRFFNTWCVARLGTYLNQILDGMDDDLDGMEDRDTWDGTRYLATLETNAKTYDCFGEVADLYKRYFALEKEMEPIRTRLEHAQTEHQAAISDGDEDLIDRWDVEVDDLQKTLDSLAEDQDDCFEKVAEFVSGVEDLLGTIGANSF